MWRMNEATLKEMRGFIERHGGQLRGGDCGETTDGSAIHVTSAR
jgi:hypothetical protein